MNRCKRMDVWAAGINDKEMVMARNGNTGACRDIPGACGCVHAEIHLLQRLKNPLRVVVSHSPCLNCAKALVQANVKRVDYVEEYRLTDGITYLESSGVLVKKLVY